MSAAFAPAPGGVVAQLGLTCFLQICFSTFRSFKPFNMSIILEGDTDLGRESAYVFIL